MALIEIDVSQYLKFKILDALSHRPSVHTQQQPTTADITPLLTQHNQVFNSDWYHDNIFLT
jgi:hypothetical protein